MKNNIAYLLVALGFALSTGAMAEGVQKSTIIQKSNNENVVAAAIGADNTVYVGSIAVKGGVQDSTIIQDTNNKNAVAAAIGTRNQVSIGSTEVN
ncbi:MAG: hypothetical protein WCG16_09645 [Methylococcales bacterium]